MKKTFYLILVVVSSLFFNSCSNDDVIDYTSEREYVVSLVESTIDLYEQEVANGTTDFTDFWNSLAVANKLSIATGNEYVFVFKMDDGLFEVHPTLSLDTDIRNVVSNDDPPIEAGRIIYEGAEENPSGSWTDYQFTNPSTNVVSEKHTYTAVSGNYGFGSGYNEE